MKARVLQASPADPEDAIAQARAYHCRAIAWNMREPCDAAVEAAARAGLENQGWLQVARDPGAIADHPEWMHAPQHHEWLRRFPDFSGMHPALVAPYIGLNTCAAFDYALEKTAALLQTHAWAQTLWLADIQGAPMGCGCGNPCCRSWDNAPGAKLAPTPYVHPELYFSLEWVQRLAARLEATGREVTLKPVLCPECERGITLYDVEDPDGPQGTDLCQGIPCVRPCALDYWPGLLRAFRESRFVPALLLMTTALGRDHPVYGAPRAWARLASEHYGSDLTPCIEPEDAFCFSNALILTDAPQTCWPVTPPADYTPELPPIMCGYCPPEA